MFRKIFVGSGCLIVLTASLGAQSGSPSCNGKTIVGGASCGSSRPCNTMPGNCPAGTGVVSQFTWSGCGAGAPSEYCTVEKVVCTRTYWCKGGSFGGPCIIDLTNPVVQGGEPIVSLTNGGVIKTCVY